MTDVRAVVVTWNGAHLLRPCLDSLLAQTAADRLEVVVVDNASTDGTAELVRSAYPGVRLVVAPRNLGFAGGVVAGCAGFTGRHVLLLNNDATLEPDALAHLLAAAQAPGCERVGAVTAKILLAGWYRAVPGTVPGPGFRHGDVTWVPCAADDAGAVRLVNSTGNVLTAWGAGVDRDWLAPDGTETTDRDVAGFSGGAALLRRAALDDVGGFDPWLFLYYEDTDVAAKMRAAGWSVRYEPAALAHHRHAASSDAASPLFRFYNTRNSLVVAGRHAAAAVVVRSAARQVAGLVLAAARRSEPGPVLRARARGLGHALVRAPRTLAERRAWRRRAAAARHGSRGGPGASAPQASTSRRGPGS